MTIERDDDETLRRESDLLHEQGLDATDRAIEINTTLFSKDPSDRDVCWRLGSGLQARGDLEAARDVFVEGIDASGPGFYRAERVLEKEILPELAKRPKRTAEEVVEHAFRSLNPRERAVCLSVIVESIEATEEIAEREASDRDRSPLAVTETQNGFSVFAGAALACKPNGEFLQIKVHARYRGLIEEIQEAGGKHLGEKRNEVQTQRWFALPIGSLEDLRDEIIDAHRAHLVEAIQARNWHRNLRLHRPDLRAYLIAANAEASRSHFSERPDR